MSLQEPFAALIGIDWSDQKHDFFLIDTSTGATESGLVKHTPEALDEWAQRLCQRFPEQSIAVCLEQSRGPLVYALLKYDFLRLFPVNPKTLARFREAFSPSRAKDDPSDAQYLAELLLYHRDRLTSWQPEDEKTRTLQLLVEQRRRLVNEQTRISNRLTALLKGYFPQVLEWFPDLRTKLVCDFLLSWPTLDAVQRARRSTLETFFRKHNSSRRPTIEKRLRLIKEAVPLTTDRAVLASSELMVSCLAQLLTTIIEAIRRFDQEIEALCREHEEFHLFSILPGAGPVYAARLLAAFGTRRERFQSAHELLCFSGIAPVIERSGKKSWTRWRYFCPKFLRQSFHEYAAESIRHSDWASSFYEQQRAAGKRHHAAIRALAFKWIRIIWKCWQSRTEYDEAKYLAVLKAKGSRLIVEEIKQEEAI